MNVLKGIVFLMTLAIAVLITLIVYGLYQKSQNPDFKFFDLSGGDTPATDGVPSAPLAEQPPTKHSAATPAPQHAPTAFGDIELDLPKGARIAQASLSGPTMVVIIDMGDGHREVWVVNLSTNTVLGRIKAQQ